jgi:acetone carboxylase gamma subunit
MKCICGYEYESKWDSKNKTDIVIKGIDPFKTMTVLGEMDICWDGYTTKNIDNRCLYICPECGTIKFNL